MSDTLHFLNMAIELARANIAAGGRPFGAVLVRDGQTTAEEAIRVSRRDATEVETIADG